MTHWLLHTEPGVAVLSVVGIAVVAGVLFAAFALLVAVVERLAGLPRHALVRAGPMTPS